ncbi:MAG: serine/threonine protein kinase [Richelia sp. RM2_1_2]|nr:serine/threonine protein kinase [Richelia sp. RM2_1_2]
MTLVPNQLVGQRYQIIKKIGEGSFGETYLAKDSNAIGREVLVKRFRYPDENRMAFLKAKELFFREAEVLLELSHNPPRSDQIPQFFAFFEKNQDFYLIEEFIKGKTLREELSQKIRFTEDEVVNLLIHLLEVLKFIHGKGIIHRDIKPENVILRDIDSKPVIIDFGAVKELLAQSGNSRTQVKDTVILTPGYTPPEQFQGKPKYNSDIYALGMIVLESLTGLEPPEFNYENINGAILSNKVKITNKLGKIIERMIDENCGSRYQSASEVLADLNKVNHSLVIAPKKFLPVSYISVTTPQRLKSLMFISLSMISVAYMSFYTIRLFISESSISNSSPIPVDLTFPRNEETSYDSVSNKKPNISAPVQSSPDSSTYTAGSDSPIRFKRANNPENLINTDNNIELKLKPNPTESSSDSKMPIRFKRSH